MSLPRHHRRTASLEPRRREPDRLLHRIRQRVSEAERLRKAQGSEAAVRAQQLQIERLQEELADAVRQDPTRGDSWGRIRQGASH
jgi:hypothetical protein